MKRYPRNPSSFDRFPHSTNFSLSYYLLPDVDTANSTLSPTLDDRRPMDYLKLPEVFILLVLLTPLLYAVAHFLWLLNPVVAVGVYLVGVLGLGFLGFLIVDRA
jgi:hypothetical protein